MYISGVNTLTFDNAYTAWLSKDARRCDESFYTNDNRPACYPEIRHLAGRAWRINRKTGSQIFKMSHKGYTAIISIHDNVMHVDTSVENCYIGNFWFTVTK